MSNFCRNNQSDRNTFLIPTLVCDFVCIAQDKQSTLKWIDFRGKHVIYSTPTKLNQNLVSTKKAQLHTIPN